MLQVKKESDLGSHAQMLKCFHNEIQQHRAREHHKLDALHNEIAAIKLVCVVYAMYKCDVLMWC